MERAEKREDKRINFVTTHSAYLPNVNKILKRHGHFLKEEGLDKYIKDTPRLSLRRGKNLADLIVNAKKKTGDAGTGPCGKECKLCKFMVETKEVTDKRGEKRKIMGTSPTGQRCVRTVSLRVLIRGVFGPKFLGQQDKICVPMNFVSQRFSYYLCS